jgi:hypothetical protein
MRVLFRAEQEDRAAVKGHHSLQLRQQRLGPVGQRPRRAGDTGDLGEDLGGVPRQTTGSHV